MEFHGIIKMTINMTSTSIVLSHMLLPPDLSRQW